MEYELFIDGKYEFLEEKSQELFSKSWDELKKSNREVARAMRQIYSALEYSEDDYIRPLGIQCNRQEGYTVFDILYAAIEFMRE